MQFFIDAGSLAQMELFWDGAHMWEHLVVRLLKLKFRVVARKWRHLWRRLQREIAERDDFWRRRILWAQVADGTLLLQ